MRKILTITIVALSGLCAGHRLTAQDMVRIGIIGLDTDHSTAFAELINKGTEPAYAGFRVTIAYPRGTSDIQESLDRMIVNTGKFKNWGIEIAPSIDNLLEKCDVVLLETCDGKPHLEQAIPVIQAKKPLFIDKPVAASLADAIAIFDLAKKNNVPVFTSSALRFASSVRKVTAGGIGKVTGADAFTPSPIEPSHPSLFWYGVHGVEMLFAVMGAGCESVSCKSSNDADLCIGVWKDGRIGTLRANRNNNWEFGGWAYGETGNAVLGPFEGYKPLLDEIIRFFRTSIPPVSAEETIDMFTFMQAVDVSKQNGGKSILLSKVLEAAH
jgi:predicted dehydrogenase